MKKNKIWLGLTGFAFFILLAIFALMFDYIYYPMKENAISDKVKEILQEEYKEEFRVNSITYGKPFGDKEGTYNLMASPVKERKIEFQLIVSQKGEILYESYKEAKWRHEANEEWAKNMNELKFHPFAINIGIPSEVEEKYTIKDSYKDIMNENPSAIEEYVFIASGGTAFDNKTESERMLLLIQQLMSRELKNFSVEWFHYKKTPKEDVFDQRGEEWTYQWALDTREAKTKDLLSKGVTVQTLQQFLTEATAK